MADDDKDKHDDDVAQGWGCAIAALLAIGLFVGTCVLR
jgi:hypothetical protein